ncbi:hypothetical protein N752_05805 [Desulforamulus aquiferis]|nr:hypothetical protein N752_05805 [Desulforamulus aquiferis]
MLNDLYGKAMVSRVFDSVGSPEKIFGQELWPSCFDCDICGIRSSCRYLNVLRRVKAIQRIQQANLPDQRSLSDIFGLVDIK